jgi:transcriptional regulator with XRE-family HTH domain
VSAFVDAFGVVLRYERQRVRLSQDELAARAGVHRTQISDIETGKVRTNIDAAKRLADALGVSLSSLVDRAERLST